MYEWQKNKRIFYNLPDSEKRDATTSSRGKSHTLTACCSDPDSEGSVKTHQSKEQMEKYGGLRPYTNKLTCYHDVCGDIAVHVGVIVEGQTGICSALALADIEQLQQWTRSVHTLSSESPPKLSWRIRLYWTEHS